MIRPLRVVLDTSAVLAYAQGRVHVGEIVAEVLDEGAEFGVPVVCLAAAAAETKDPDRLEVLVRRTGCVVVPHVAADWRSLGFCVAGGRPFDLAAAMLAAVGGSDAHIVSGMPNAYAPAGDAVSVIGV